jgi:hypothetical protein
MLGVRASSRSEKTLRYRRLGPPGCGLYAHPAGSLWPSLTSVTGWALTSSAPRCWAIVQVIGSVSIARVESFSVIQKISVEIRQSEGYNLL